MRLAIRLAIVAYVFALGVVLGHNVNIYDGANKGVTFGSCGFEFVGSPGPFCNVN